MLVLEPVNRLVDLTGTLQVDQRRVDLVICLLPLAERAEYLGEHLALVKSLVLLEALEGPCLGRDCLEEVVCLFVQFGNLQINFPHRFLFRLARLLLPLVDIHCRL